MPQTSASREAHVITQSYKTTEESSDGSSSGSNGHETIVERLIARSAAGAELEYDLPDDATAQDRARAWQFPARVLRTPQGELRLLNSAELEDRLTLWLKSAGWDRTACGRTILTWNAFRIECDPQSILTRIREVDLLSHDIRAGASYSDPLARNPGTLARSDESPDGSSLTAVLDVDADKTRLQRAEADVAVAELMQQSITLESALRNRSDERISGTISVVWKTDARGVPVRRTTTTSITITRPDGEVEKRTATTIVERRILDR